VGKRKTLHIANINATAAPTPAAAAVVWKTSYFILIEDKDRIFTSPSLKSKYSYFILFISIMP